MRSVLIGGLAWGVMAMGLVSGPASGGVMLSSGTISGTAESDVGDTATQSTPVVVGLAQINLSGPSESGERTTVMQSVLVSSEQITLDGTLESITARGNQTTGGMASADLSFTVSTASLLDFALSLEAEREAETRFFLTADRGPSPLFVFTGDGSGGARAFDDEFLVSPGVVYSLSVNLESSVPESEDEVSMTTSYALSISLMAVPEPAALGLLLLGAVVGVGVCGRRGERVG
ncbi:MAG: PEP-CTERM sorting domain-containing protein [Planctomycetota bacterium]